RRAVQRHRRRAARLAEAVAALATSPREVVDESPDHEDRLELAFIMQELEATRPQDADLIRHRLRGRRWREVSRDMGVSEEALRQRWSALMARLRSRRRAAPEERRAAG
ncbi:MAG: hypothetical protein RL190_1464, partial [Actinomycetota bacterium]